MKKLYLLLGAALISEAALLKLGHWQYNRYQQRLNEQTQATARPPETLSGTFTSALAALTGQPDPTSPEDSGWRVYGVLETSTTHVLINRGYIRPVMQAGTPDFSTLQPPSQPLTLQGVWVPIPARKGWLKGPDTTTHPQLLAFLNPALITSNTLAPQQFVLTLPETSATTLLPSAPPLASPMRHLSYMIQWLVMAAVFPLLCWGAVHKTKR